MYGLLAFIAYGALMISGCYMAFFWGRNTIRRWHQIGRDIRLDRYGLIASCLSLAAMGTTSFFATRAYGLIAYGGWLIMQPGPLPVVILVALYILAIAKVGFVWAVAMDYSSKIWLSFIVLNLIWIGCASVWFWYHPFSRVLCGL